MQGPGFIAIVLALLLATACTSSSLPSLPPPRPPPQVGNPDTSQAPVEVVSIVAGTPTAVYALVARGALRCWFGADGPLKPTHVFHAEAESPAKGGAAEIVVHERDESLRDKRGARAFLVSISSGSAGVVRVAIAMPRMELQLGQLMAKDVEGWAKGGTDCEVRRHVLPRPHTPVIGKGDAGSSKRR